MNKTLFILVFCLAIGVSPAFGQVYPADVYYKNGSPRSPQEVETRKKLYDINKENSRIAQMRNLSKFLDYSPRSNLSREDRKIIAPDDADLIKYKKILALPKTGMIKLLKSECFTITENNNPIELDNGCRTAIPGFGAFYSFRNGHHAFRTYSDIQLFRGWLVTSGLLTQGILVSLGEVDFEKVSLQSGGVKFLTEFIPAETATEADEQKSFIENGIEKDGFYYNRAVEIKENTVYAIRSVAYRSKLKLSDNRKDVIVVFKAIRKDSNGDVTLIQRELQSKDAPEIKEK